MVRLCTLMGLLALLSGRSYAFDLQSSPSNGESAGLDYVIIHPDDHTRDMQYVMMPDAMFSPYVSAEREDDHYDWDIYWRDNHYQSSHQPERGNAWAGVKVKLSKMLRFDVDTNTRNIRSSLKLSPKTRVKFRARLNGFRADIVYRY